MIRTQSIPKPDNVRVVKHEDGDTWDIVKVILEADGKLGKYMCEFASQFEVSYAGLYDLWYWVHKNIKYIADKPGHEKVKDPRVTWQDGYGDCKSFSLFIASVLRCLQIRYKYRFASYDKEKHPTHVYVVANFDNREIILDAVHNKFDDEADYQNKWDKMPTRISYLHGTNTPAVRSIKARPSRLQRIADAPQKAITLPDLNISNLTGGQTTLELLDRQLQILIGYYGDSDGILQKARNIIFQAKRGHFHYNNTFPTGYVDPRLNDLLRQIKEAARNTRINGTNHHIGELEYKRPASYPKNCNDLFETQEYKTLAREYASLTSIEYGNPYKPGYRHWTPAERARAKELKKYLDALSEDLNNCKRSQEFTDLLTKRIDKSAHHMLYEFINDPNSQTNSVSVKSVLHKVAISSLGQLAYIDRNNIRIMAENGIMSTNATIKDFGDISPANAIAILKEAHKYNVPEARIGELFTLITGLIVAISGAIAAAASFQDKMNESKKLDFQSKVNGFGTQEFSPDPLDFDEFKKQQEEKESSFSFSKILPYALLGGTALFVLPGLIKK